MILFAVVLVVLMVIGNSVVTNIPVVFYLGESATAVANVEQYLYYHIALCPRATQNYKQVQLEIALPNNPGWTNTSTDGFVMAQVSICEGSFTQNCVIAQNYVWNNGINIKAEPVITWTHSNDTGDIFIRILSANLPTEFSMELQMVNANPSHYSYVNDFPFSGSSVTKTPTVMGQYWRANAQYNVCVYTMYMYTYMVYNVILALVCTW